MLRIKLYKCLICALIIAVTFVGCGLGDRTYPLINGYEICKDADTCGVHKENGGINISNFYITAYSINAPYVMLEGVETAYLFAEEKELESKIYRYYLVNTETDEVYGMFDSMLQLEYQCEELSVSIDFEWVSLS